MTTDACETTLITTSGTLQRLNEHPLQRKRRSCSCVLGSIPMASPRWLSAAGIYDQHQEIVSYARCWQRGQVVGGERFQKELLAQLYCERFP